MNPVLKAHRASIAALCRQYGVRRLDVFGSAAGGAFSPDRSDVDFMVEFADRSPRGAADRYFGLHEDLQRLLGCPVDLVMPSAVRNPYFLQVAERQRVKLYAA